MLAMHAYALSGGGGAGWGVGGGGTAGVEQFDAPF
jgi:hypothetical protein